MGHVVTRVNARLEPGAAVALDAILAADGSTVTTVVNEAIRALARSRGLVQAPDLEARVTALEDWRRETEKESTP